MLFENQKQFELAKRTLMNNEGDVITSIKELKESNEFKNMDNVKLSNAMYELNEGLADAILNFVGDKLGGDISKIKTVLTQMKDQELKFNSEELDIYESFYRVIQDQKALDKEHNNPSYDDLSKELKESRAGLNSRLKELTKTHNEIFDALESKIKDLVGDNKRKRKYFNAQRASDVLETKTDRYEKIKAITSKSSERSQELEDFFGVSTQQAQTQVNKAQQNARKQAKKIVPKTTGNEPGSSRDQYNTDPERDLGNRLFDIKEIIATNPTGIAAKRKLAKDLDTLIQDIDTAAKGTSVANKKATLRDISQECGSILQKI
jgi:hypothetical protein